MKYYKHKKYNKILKKDVYQTRPMDMRNISTEQMIRVGYHAKKAPFKKSWKVFETITYEMSGSYHRNSQYMGGKTWAETDFSGAVWWFENENDANNFLG